MDEALQVLVAPVTPTPGADVLIDAAIQKSVLSALAPETLTHLLSDAMRIDIPAGSVVYREGDAPRCGLLVTGLARVFLAAADGRQVTIRYMVPGSLSGSSLVVRGESAGVRVQAVTDITGLLLNVTTLRAMAQVEAGVAWAFATEIAHSQEEITRAFSISIFGTLRQRIARHLLDLATMHHEQGRLLVAAITQQELAESIGSTREAVARLLRELRDAHIVETQRGGIALLDPERLHAQAAVLTPQR